MDRYELLKLGAETGLLFSSVLLFYGSHGMLRKDSKLLAFLEQAYEFSPKTLIEVLEETVTDSVKRNFLKFDQDESFAKLTGFIKGKVFTQSPITSYLDNTIKLAANKLTVEPIFTNTKLIDARDIIVKRGVVKEILLNDVSHSNKVLVRNLSAMNYDLSLTKIASKSEFKTLGLIRSIFPTLIRVFQVLFSLIRIYPQFKGFRVGHKISEYGLPIHQTVLAMGKMIYDKRNKILIMDKPKYLLQDKSQLISLYKNRVIRYSRLKLLSLVFVLLFGFLSVRRFLKLTNGIKQYLQNAKERFYMEKLSNLGRILPDEFKCIICIDNPKNVIFKPCLHMAICQTCCQKLDKRTCPICKKPIRETVNIFVN
jgi:hypothetical protein